MIHSALKNLTNSQSLYINTVANFIGLSYSIVIGLVIFPLYLKYLGAEAFGLIGFFTVLQTWMQVLDMGMSPMLSRQTALARGNYIELIKLKKISRSIETILLVFSIIVFLVIFINSDLITRRWLHIAVLKLDDVTNCIIIMGAIIGPGLFSSLYRSGIRGAEKQALLNAVTIFLVSLKFIGALVIIKYITTNIVYFFLYQFIISIVEIVVLNFIFYNSIPSKKKHEIYSFSLDIVRQIFPFAGGIAYTAGIWSLLSQVDKLILSKILSLSEYGYFTLAVTISTGITQISVPISQAILPRMTYLLSQGKEDDMILLYRMSTRYVSILLFPVAGMIACFSHELLWAWTGDAVAAKWASPVLTWFAIGNAILAISAFQYYMQFAYGNIKIHIISSSISVFVEIPIIIYSAFQYGALGVSFIWFIMKLSSFFIVTSIVHNKFAKGIHLSWIMKDVFPSVVTTTIFVVIFKYIILFQEISRAKNLFILAFLGCIILFFIIFILNRDIVLSIFRYLKKFN